MANSKTQDYKPAKETPKPLTDSAFFEAARKGDVGTLKRMLNSGFDINKKDETGKTALFIASECGKTEAVKLLLADADTSLHIAIKNGDLEMVKQLLSDVADIYQVNYNGLCALDLAHSIAFPDGSDESNDFLASNPTNALGYVKKIAYAKNAGTEKQILYHVLARAVDISSALHVARGTVDGIVKKVSKISELIQDQKSVKYRNKDGDTMLHASAASGKDDYVALILKAGADINAQNFYGNTALHLAAKNGHVSVVSKLLEMGADPLVKNFKEESASKMCSELPKDVKTEITLLLLNAARKKSEKPRELSDAGASGLTASEKDSIPSHGGAKPPRR